MAGEEVKELEAGLEREKGIGEGERREEWSVGMKRRSGGLGRGEKGRGGRKRMDRRRTWEEGEIKAGERGLNAGKGEGGRKMGGWRGRK